MMIPAEGGQIGSTQVKRRSVRWGFWGIGLLLAVSGGGRVDAVAMVLPGRHLPTVDGAVRLTMDPVGNHLFVGGPKMGQLVRDWRGPGVAVTAIAGQTGLKGHVGGAAFSPDGTQLYWADGGVGAISIFATEVGNRVGTLRLHTVEGGPRGAVGKLGEMVVRGDGQVLFVMDLGRQRVVSVDAVTGRIVGALPVGTPGKALVGWRDRLFGIDAPTGVGGGGSMWMAEVGAPEGMLMRHRWKTQALWASFLGVSAEGIGVGADDLAVDGYSLYVAQASARLVVRMDLGTGRMGAWHVLKGRGDHGEEVGAEPRGLAVDAAGERLYVAEAGWDAIGVLDARTLNVLGHVPTPGYPYRVKVSSDGEKLVCLSLEGLRMGETPAEVGLGGRPEGAGARAFLTILDAPSTADLAAGSSPVLARAGVGSIESSGSVVTLPSGEAGNGGGVVLPGLSASAMPLPTVTMPIEVLGLAGTREEIGVPLTGMEALRGATLCLTVHGVQYEDKVKVTLNGAYSVSINNRTAKILGNAKRFGGLGGGFHTIPLELEIPKGVLREGENRFAFEYTRQNSYAVSGFQSPDNRIDDASSGFRVVRMNLKDRAGRVMLGPERFRDDDPEQWGPPETEVPLEQAVQDGGKLWRGRKPDGTPFRLKNFSAVGLTPAEIKATCSDCHAQDGRDLKYYNYSNRSIVARSRIHGLSDEEGRRIAAYIRTLSGAPVVPRARPWNPPFQPGPGLDSRPVYEWAAGAGLDAVVEDPVETYNGIFPGAYRKTSTGEGVWDLSKISADRIRPNGSLSMREVPISMQLLDWNQWLPKVHPIDGFAEGVATNALLRAQLDGYMKMYSNTVARIRAPSGATNFSAVVSFCHASQAAMTKFRESYEFDRRNHTLKEAQRRYPLLLLPLVKSWEFYVEFGLGDRIARETCGSEADERSWRVGMLPFVASPNIGGMLDTREPGVPYAPRNGHGIGNNREVTFNYVSSAWYHLQLILDHGNRNPRCGVNVAAPLDWPYVMAHLRELQMDDGAGAGLSMMPLMYLYLAKAPQIYNTGLGVDASQSGGWQPYMLMPYYLQLYSHGTSQYQAMAWQGVPSEVRGKLMDTVYRVWLDKNLESPRELYFVPVFAHDPTSYLGYVEPQTRIGKGAFGTLADRVHFSLAWKSGSFDGTLNGFGVSPELQNELIDWAKTIWPKNGDGTPAPWDEFRPALTRRQR